MTEKVFLDYRINLDLSSIFLASYTIHMYSLFDHGIVYKLF